MTQQDERSAFEARLPDDPAYWSELTEQITRSTEPMFAQLEAQRAWWNPLARFGPSLGIGALAAAAAAIVVLSTGGPDTSSPPRTPVTMTVNPTDLVENAFRTPSTPDVVLLMVLANEDSP